MKDKWLQFWSLLSDANDEMNEFLSGNVPIAAQKGLKKFINIFNKMKQQAEQIDDIIQTPVDSVEVKMPWSTDTFKKQWAYWKDYKMETFSQFYKSRHEQKALEYLKEISENNEEQASKILDFAMANGYPRFFKFDDKNKNKVKQQANETDSDFD